MLDKGISRRRAITIFAATVAGVTMGPPAAEADDYEWRGYAMGADARIVFGGVNQDVARALGATITAEIERLENALSLFQTDSEIVRLNRDKRLSAPTADMVRALQLAIDIADATGGLFDPTVQALWKMYVDWFGTAPQDTVPPSALVTMAREAVDWRMIDVNTEAIRLGDNQAITLNGLGQGYVTDRVADLLQSQGFDHVLVDLGEQRALGPRRNGTPWLVMRHDSVSGIELSKGALATSEGRGCILGGNGAVHHLFDPRTGRSAEYWQSVTVHHRSATVADALSTALSSATADEISKLASTQKFGETTVWAVDRDGRQHFWR